MDIYFEITSFIPWNVLFSGQIISFSSKLKVTKIHKHILYNICKITFKYQILIVFMSQLMKVVWSCSLMVLKIVMGLTICVVQPKGSSTYVCESTNVFCSADRLIRTILTNYYNVNMYGRHCYFWIRYCKIITVR